MSGKLNEDLKKCSSAYDETYYECYPYHHTRPESLKILGMLFGMKPADMETAKILELGCGDGNNIINFAANYPRSCIIGVDICKTAIDNGKKAIKDLGLKNIKLKQCSITDIDEYFGKFDYIICHGVFSWVPEVVRDKILEISKSLLNKDGVVYISYNTLPGWNMTNTVRDMMVFHSAIFEDTSSKIEQARLFLHFIADSLEGDNSPYTQFLRERVTEFSGYTDNYLIHEYLAEENVQFYFHEFMSMASEKGLQYLGDAVISSMFLGNLPEKAVTQLAAINDIIITEQYMDFIKNRQFRCTLLCHNDVKLVRNITPGLLNDFYTASILHPTKAENEVNFNDAMESLQFRFGEGDTVISTSSPIVKAILYTYYENMGNPLKPEDIVILARKKLDKFTVEEFMADFGSIVPRLVLCGYIVLFEGLPKSIFTISKKPKVSYLCRYQLKHYALDNRFNKYWVVNHINETFIIEIYEKFILECLDGNHDRSQLEKMLIDKFKTGELKVTDGNKVEDVAKRCVEQSLERFKRNYILVA